MAVNRNDLIPRISQREVYKGLDILKVCSILEFDEHTEIHLQPIHTDVHHFVVGVIYVDRKSTEYNVVWEDKRCYGSPAFDCEVEVIVLAYLVEVLREMNYEEKIS